MYKPELELYYQAGTLDNFTEKQLKILTAAIQIFSEKGYENTSTKEIAEAAGVAEGNIFAKFKNKRGLLNAIIEPVLNRVFPSTIDSFIQDKLSQNYSSTTEFVHALLIDRMDMVKDNDKVFKIFFTELFYDHQVRQNLINIFPNIYWQKLNTLIDELKADHILNSLPNSDIIRTLWSIMGGLVLGYLFFNQPLDDRTIDSGMTALIEAIEPKVF
ncbi:TetR/AcrR family transcriptional regulator [Lentilactobacillus sp. SPB1-3]|uniref:TetR/AcrR family transcriptional regulator n=1 Tax=Lentilactobacillus terminaliae TaxID=3003483 RepID=A0ACD5DF33_9LACO|nr:TetR/AcrR family transcriptional regulator [Lentilactobacillus sp. SPB1-3]MCZ0976408.1 TetR/AcrR family transcriptional regulator [Lentilactobacillus sp. SPB1-3]